MARAGEVSIGQLARERLGPDQVVLVGFGTHRGTVIAGDAWGESPHELPVPPARRGSLEDALHRAAPAAALAHLETTALRPLPTRRADALEPETYPTGS